MTTLGTLIEHHKVGVLDHLDRDSLVPVHTALQCQGDIAVIPMRAGKVAGAQAVPAEGVVLVRGESGGNTHLLLPSPGVTFAPAATRGLDLGTLVVEAAAECYIAHPEHGYLGVGPGQYVVRRQRQQADEIRLVAD